MDKLDQIREILDDHDGPENAISSADIADELDIEENATRARTRELIWRTMRVHRIPVGADTRGYFVVDDDETYQDCIQLLEKRQDGIEERKQLLQDIYEEDND